MEKENLKKLSLNKEEIINLNDEQMDGLRGGSAWGKFSRDVLKGLSTEKLTEEVEDLFKWSLDQGASVMKENTVWVGCTTDPARSRMYNTPGCIAPYQTVNGQPNTGDVDYPVGV